VTEGPASPRLSIVWSVEARADLRAIDRQAAIDILHCVDRYLATRNGDVKQLRHPQSGFRLRCGDYRIFFFQPSESVVFITAVRHRREAYR
jgi:mRNA-degrading endonuclease RelE of RelBE toxin-antitoxin system